MSNETKVKNFTLDLRRVLYLQQILRYSLEGLKQNELCPSFLKNEANTVMNATRRLRDVMSDRTTVDNRRIVMDDLNNDRLHDIALHIDAIADIANIDRITEIINEHKLPVTA